ncbi:MAG: UvrD-helicase domain-containing protein, partial [Candidatus Cloacimonetes bacterium]|nr:UvrD-helicase domain-containing protein [Candidatus Cloacimonadota bacterium]
MIDFHRDLNEPQREVVSDVDHPILVLAGAGSGKTRCIIYRAAYLIHERNVPPWKLLIVTFTNKAA